MDKKTAEAVSTVCSLIGGTLMGIAVLYPEMQKLTSNEIMDELKLLPDSQDKQDKQEKHDTEENTKDNEIAELKRKLAELESKTSEKSEN